MTFKFFSSLLVVVFTLSLLPSEVPILEVDLLKFTTSRGRGMKSINSALIYIPLVLICSYIYLVEISKDQPFLAIGEFLGKQLSK